MTLQNQPHFIFPCICKLVFRFAIGNMGMKLSFLFRKGNSTRRFVNGQAMAEVSKGRSQAITALATKAHQCSVDIDAAKSALALIRPKDEQIRRTTAEGASLQKTSSF